MTSLIRNQSHNNKIITLFLPNQKVIRKISYSSQGIRKIKNEYNGLDWYQKKKKYKLVSNLKINKNSAIIDIKRIDGRIVDYNQPITKTKKYLIKIINHYKKIWHFDKNLPSHGDLTLDNIIFKNKNIFIIDWEHFEIGKKDKGFDIAYLVFSALILPNKKELPSDEEINVASELWYYIYKKGCISKRSYLNPTDFFKKNIKKKWLKINNINYKKIIFSLISRNNLYEIQKKILSKLNDK